MSRDEVGSKEFIILHEKAYCESLKLAVRICHKIASESPEEMREGIRQFVPLLASTVTNDLFGLSRWLGKASRGEPEEIHDKLSSVVLDIANRNRSAEASDNP